MNELPIDGPLLPPPLPPRRRNRESEEGLSRLDNAPEIPPRVPPPVPPRRDSMFSSLSRTQSMSQQPRSTSGLFQNVPGQSLNATLPRCSALERDLRPSIPTFNINGDDSSSRTTTPQLPPKTYKHIRQQSN